MHPIYSHYQKPFLKSQSVAVLLNYLHILLYISHGYIYTSIGSIHLKIELTRWNILVINNEMGKWLLLRFVPPVQLKS